MQSSVPAGETGTASTLLRGTVTYRQRIALHPASELTVTLEDISLADAPAKLIAKQTIMTDGKQVPIPFELRYSPAKIDDRHRYSVRAQIRDPNGALRWTSDTAQLVLTNGAPTTDVAITLTQAAATNPASATASIVGSWKLLSILTPDGGSITPPADQRYSLELDEQGRYSGQAHCNRYTGRYQRTAPDGIDFNAGAATLAACAPPSLAGQLQQALAQVDAYTATPANLHLRAPNGQALRFARQQDNADSGEAPHMLPQIARVDTRFTCTNPSGESLSLRTRTGPGELALWLPEQFESRYLVLGQTRAASGVRYAGEGIVFWSKGRQAQAQLNGINYQCEQITQ